MDRIPGLRRAILADTPLPVALTCSVLIVAALTLARWLLDGGAMGMQFAPYFPFLLIITLLFGWRSGGVAAILSAVAANRLLRDDPVLFYVSWKDAAMFAFFCGSSALLVYIGEVMRRLVRELERAKTREEVLSGELRHRAKNTLSIVSALASLTRRRASDGDFFPAFAGRIKALDRATDLLSGPVDGSREIGQLLSQAIEPFRSEDNFRLDGPACDIPRASCMPLMLVLHELCTNAAKHGALTAPDGVITIVWDVLEEPAVVLRIRWLERGGPTVPEASTPGMGSTLMRAQNGLRGVELRLPPAGAECDILIEDVRPH